MNPQPSRDLQACTAGGKVKEATEVPLILKLCVCVCVSHRTAVGVGVRHENTRGFPEKRLLDQGPGLSWKASFDRYTWVLISANYHWK